MDFVDLSRIEQLSLPYLLLLAFLVCGIVVSLCTLAYVGIRAAFDAWRDWKTEQMLHASWLEEQARVHNDSRNAAARTVRTP